MAIDRPYPAADVNQEFAGLEDRLSAAEYNYEHFRVDHLLADLRRTFTNSGIMPGDAAPDFELPLVDGGTLRLSELRGKPVLLHFGSFT